MNRLAALTLAAGLACVLAAADLAAAEPTPQALLTDAILCKVDPLAAVRKMAASGSSSLIGDSLRRPSAKRWTRWMSSSCGHRSKSAAPGPRPSC